MARYDLIQIGSIYLTSNGLVGGTPCKTKVTNKGRLRANRTGQVIIAADDSVVLQNVFTRNAGVRFDIIISWLNKTVYDNIVSAIQTSLDNGSTINISIVGDTGSLSLVAIPDPSKLIEADKFRNSILVDVTFGFISTT